MIIFSLFVCNLTYAQIAREEAYSIVKKNVLNNDYEAKNILVSKELILPSDTLKILSSEFITPNYESWFFLIDDMPFANWGHDCLYVFVNAENGNIFIHNDIFPPLMEMDVLYKVPVNASQTTSRFMIQNSQTDFCISQNNYAVIISGGGWKEINYERYWNDCAAIYTMLINKFHFDKSKIYIIMSDGIDPAHDRTLNDGTTDSSPLDLDGDGLDDIQFAAKKSNITYVFDQLSDIITSDDNVFIFITDHGTTDKWGAVVSLLLWGEEMTTNQFAEEVDKINLAHSINIVMGQCFSGAFIPALKGNNRIISTACKADESSWSMLPDNLYDEFLYHWMSAINGVTLLDGTIANADYNSNGFVTMDEAFQFAFNADTQDETPQYLGGDFGSINSFLPIFENYSTTNNLFIPYTSIISENFEINAGHIVNINATVLATSNASITIQPGGKLIIDGGTITNACEGEMWQGITVMGDPTKVLQQQYQGYVQITNSGKIENAITGITVNGGGMVSATNAEFVNNTTGVHFLPLSAGQSGTSGTFTNTDFTLNNNYLGNPANFDSHIEAQNSGSITVKGCSFTSSAPKDDISNNYGIKLFNTSLSVSANCNYIVFLPPCNTNPSTFSGFYHAISATNSGASPVISITGSSFINNIFGINLKTTDYAKLIRNDFKVTQDYAVGARLSYCTGYVIEENNFWTPTNLYPAITTGVAINNSGVTENEVYRNSFSGLYVGQNFYCHNAVQQVPYSGLQTLCNTHQDNQYLDILVGELGPRAVCTDHSIRRDQGSMQLPAGNQFSPNLTPHFKNESQYLINYHHSNNPIEIPAISGYIVKNATTAQNNCPFHSGIVIKEGLGKSLAQYDEWNEQYEYWLNQLLVTEEDSEEYELILNNVSYYSALKDNYFNEIIVEAMNEENGEGRMENGEKSPSNFEGVDGEAGRGSLYENLYETLRFLFN
ncbi:MAG: C13 family peptidase, partial [Lentimicrobiaceae bacterium]|nr:C13 family peptidase [Lentimicrobiaceae bacterium]